MNPNAARKPIGYIPDIESPQGCWMTGEKTKEFSIPVYLHPAAPSPATPEAEGANVVVPRALFTKALDFVQGRVMFSANDITELAQSLNRFARDYQVASPPAAQPSPDEPEVVKMLSKVIEGWKKCAAEWDDEGDSPRASDYIDCADELEEFLKWYRKPDGHFPKVAATQEQKPVLWWAGDYEMTRGAFYATQKDAVAWAETQQELVSIRPLFASPAPVPEGWVNTPDAQGLWWHWNGDPDDAPYPCTVLWSGTANKYFVCIKDIATAPFCDTLAGKWLHIPQAAAPVAPKGET